MNDFNVQRIFILHVCNYCHWSIFCFSKSPAVGLIICTDWRSHLSLWLVIHEIRSENRDCLILDSDYCEIYHKVILLERVLLSRSWFTEWLRSLAFSTLPLRFCSCWTNIPPGMGPGAVCIVFTINQDTWKQECWMGEGVSKRKRGIKCFYLCLRGKQIWFSPCYVIFTQHSC